MLFDVTRTTWLLLSQRMLRVISTVLSDATASHLSQHYFHLPSQIRHLHPQHDTSTPSSRLSAKTPGPEDPHALSDNRDRTTHF